MKKLFSIALAVLLVAVFSACGNASPSVDNGRSENGVGDQSNLINSLDVASSENSQSNQSGAQNKEKISVENAKSVALNKAGFSAEQVKFLRAELDFDDGVYKYEIEFSKDGYEYECDVEAYSGKVLKFEKERDD